MHIHTYMYTYAHTHIIIWLQKKIGNKTNQRNERHLQGKLKDTE